MGKMKKNKLDLILDRLETIEKKFVGLKGCPWLLAKEAAAYLRISVSKLDEIVAKGRIPFKRIDPDNPKSPRLFHRKDLVAHLVCASNPQTHRLTQSEKRIVVALL